MSVPLLTETSTVCRTCLKVLDTTGFTYLDDDSGYVKNVGNIREMLQFCVPELDLYVSAKPVICYQCLPILVQVYNFKIRSLNVESSIRAYISRNNLHEYNHVNLNCVLMDDLRMNSQKIQIENRIKHLMLKETEDQGKTQQDLKETFNSIDETSIYPMNITETEENDIFEEGIAEKQMKIEIEEPDEEIRELDRASQKDSVQEEQDDGIINNNVENGEANEAKQISAVAVRKDLFSTKDAKEPPPIILNNGLMPQNGRIVIKIDRKALRTVGPSPETHDIPATITPIPEPVAPSHPPPPASPPTLINTDSNEQLETSSTTADGDGTPPTYTCNKCTFITQDIIKMYDHNRSCHNFDYTCNHCPFSTSKVELLGKHMTSVHPENMVNRNVNYKISENYACALCPFSVRRLELLRSHHLTAHGLTDGQGPTVLNPGIKVENCKFDPKIVKRIEYTCDVCPYSTRDKSNLRKHLFTHGTKPLKCDYCSYKCVSPYQLRRHQKQKHAKHMECKVRSQPYKLPDLQPKPENMDDFKITLESIKKEIEKEITA